MSTYNRILVAAVLLTGSAITAAASAADTYKLDPMHTQAIFSVSHLGYSKISGGFQDIKGTLLFDERKLQNSSVDVTIATASINTLVEARDADLKSARFFNVEKYPTMAFKSTKVTDTGDGTADVSGDLTIIGVTRPATLHVKYNRGAPDQMRANANVVGFSATGSIKRSDYGMKTFLPYLGDDVALTINAEAVKQ